MSFPASSALDGHAHANNNSASTASGSGGGSKSRMYVLKRSGVREPVHFDKITSRINKLCYGLDHTFVDPTAVAQKVCMGVYTGVTTSELDELAAEVAAHMSSKHPDYGLLAARVAVSNLHKNTKKTFTDVMHDLYTYVHPITKKPAPLLDPSVYAFIMKHKERLNSTIVFDRDYAYDYFGFKTVERSYLLKLHDEVAERPQHMLLRVACGIHPDDIDAAVETYNLLSQKWFTHASPTLFNSGTPQPQMSSCFLLSMKDDSIEGIFDTLKQCALISKFAGGIGLAVSNIRATGSYIRGTNGKSNGLIPMLRCFNNVARYVDQCFTPTTQIQLRPTPSASGSTTNHSVVMDKVRVGDEVLTHTGSYRRVSKILAYDVEGVPLLTVVTARGKVRVTGKHPFLCLRGSSKTKTPDQIRGRLRNGLSKLDWEDADTLTPGQDWLALPAKMCAGDLLEGELAAAGQVLCPILSVAVDDVTTTAAAELYRGKLYDLEVEGDHSYVTEVGIVHNGGGKRKGSFAIYLEPWHADIIEFLDLKKNHGSEEMRTRDLFLGLWIPDLFMKRVEEDKSWSLFCPNEAPGLMDVWGADFVKMYEAYEAQGRARKVVAARTVWQAILESQCETGTPYMLYKDSVNAKSNYKHIGTIRSSNLCVAPDTRILTDKGQIAIGTLKDTDVNAWNGQRFSPVTVRQTGHNQQMVNVSFSDGTQLCCTPEHKFLIATATDADTKTAAIAGAERPFAKYKRLAAHELTSGMRLPQWALPAALQGDSAQNLARPYDAGLLCGNGGTDSRVPINADRKNKLEWLAGVCDGCGTASDASLEIHSASAGFLRDIRLMLQTLGVQSSIDTTDARGRLLVGSVGGKALLELGFAPKRMKLSNAQQSDVCRFVSVVGVDAVDGRSDTYCFTERDNNVGVFNGQLTGQCVEIVEYTSADEVAVCNLASIGLPMYVTKTGFDHKKLYEVTQVITKNLNKIIDRNHYPVPEAKRSNLRHRPIGIGVQGLADTLALLRIPYETPEGRQLNRDIFETMYFAALTASNDLAAKEGPYESYPGSPASQGILQYDMWNVKPSARWDWAGLKSKIAKHGLRNAMLIAPMPTASTSQMLSNNEAMEPFNSNIYVRRTLAGEFVCVTRYLMHDLIKRGLWTDKTRNMLIAHNGSVQNIPWIPDDLKALYKTVWEIKIRTQIDYAADRGAFIDQSQSFNVHMTDVSFSKLTAMHFYGWKAGLKSGMYYLRSQAATDAIKFTVDAKLLREHDPITTNPNPNPNHTPNPTHNSKPPLDSKSDSKSDIKSGTSSSGAALERPPPINLGAAPASFAALSGQLSPTPASRASHGGVTDDKQGVDSNVFDNKTQGISPSALWDKTAATAAASPVGLDPATSPDGRDEKRPPILRATSQPQMTPTAPDGNDQTPAAPAAAAAAPTVGTSASVSSGSSAITDGVNTGAGEGAAAPAAGSIKSRIKKTEYLYNPYPNEGACTFSCGS